MSFKLRNLMTLIMAMILSASIASAQFVPEPHTPGGKNPQVPEPNTPGKPQGGEDPARIRQVAGEQAEMMANRVVAIYGAAESELYSFYLGLRQGVGVYNLITGSLENSGDYRSGEGRGSRDGENAGRPAGESAGQNEGTSAGYNAAANRFSSVVDQNTNPNTSMPTFSAPNKNFTANLSQPKSLEERLNSKNNQMYQVLNSQRYEYEDYRASHIFDSNTVTLGQLYNMQGNYNFNKFVDSYARASWAWDAWRSRDLGGRYENAVDYYNKLAGSDRDAFVHEFKYRYDDVINGKWRGRVRQVDPFVQQEGMLIGLSAAKDYAGDMGYNAGYQKSYNNGAQSTYTNSYNQSAQTGFNNGVRELQSSAKASELNASLEPSEGWPFLPGSPITINIHGLKNIGRVNGQFSVSTNGKGSRTIKGATVNLAASSSLKSGAGFSWLEQINFDVASDEDQTVNVNVGGANQTLTFKVYFWDVVKALSQAPSGSQKEGVYLGYIQRVLGQEWNSKTGGSYSKGGSRLEQIVKVYNSLNGNERSHLSAYRESLRGAYGSRPGFFSGRRDAWDHAQNILSQIK